MNTKLRAAAAVTALTAAATPAPASAATDLDRAISSTVIVSTSEGVGAGVHLGEGRVLTAAHVADQATVRLGDSKDESLGAGRVVARDTVRDLALVAVDSPDVSRLGTSHLRADPAHVGESVFAAGAPGQDYIQLSAGIVSAVVEQGSVNRVQTDAPVNPGNSGGPLLDENGDVVGIVVTKSATEEGMGWATSADEASDFLAGADSLVGAPESNAPPEAGEESASDDPSAQVTQHAPMGALLGVTAVGLGALAWAGARSRRRQNPVLDLSDLAAPADADDWSDLPTSH